MIVSGSDDMNYAFYEYQFGYLKVGYENSAVYYLGNSPDIDAENIKSAFSDSVYNEIDEYLQGKRKSFDFPFEMCGTPFQKKVWDALRRIPYGETRSYKDIAKEIGNEKACRAVGMANNRNPIIIAVPCHRVIGANGSLTGYACGLGMKEALLELEKKNKGSSD